MDPVNGFLVADTASERVARIRRVRDEATVPDDPDDGLDPMRLRVGRRITSYNVCYTKLLRVVTNKPENLTNPLLDRLGLAGRSACTVITSYSIHYTKLYDSTAMLFSVSTLYMDSVRPGSYA